MKKLIVIAAAATALGCAAQVNMPTVEGYLERGVLMYRDANYVGCIDQLTYLKNEEATREQREEADFYISLATAHMGGGDALQMLKRFICNYPASPHCDEARVTIGDLLLDAADYAEALKAYEEINPDNLDSQQLGRLNYGEAYCLLKMEEYDRAEALYKSLGAWPDYANDARFYEGYIAYCRGDYRRAVELLRGVRAEGEPTNMADFYLAQIYYNDGDYEKASSMARRLMSRNDVEAVYIAEAARIAGESLYHLGNDGEAIELLRRYMEMTDSPVASARYILGVADYRTGDYQGAINTLTPVASIDSAMGQSANLFIGQALMQMRNYSSAMIAFDKALQMTHDTDVRETAFYNYAVAKTQGGRIPFGSSVSTFEEFLKEYPRSVYAPRVREYIVTGYMTDDNYPAALASIEAIKNPSESILKAKQTVLYTLGTRELAAGETASAISRLEQARALRNHNAEIGAETELWLGDAYYAAGRYGDARGSYQAYLDMSAPTAANRQLAVYDLAYSLFSDKNYDEAAKNFRDFVTAPGASSPGMIADAHNRIGDCLYYRSEFASAADAYGKAASANPGSADYALYQEAMMKGLQRDYRGKIEGMQRMVKEFPKSSLVSQALIEMGESYEQLGMTDKAIETYSLAATRYPSSQQGRQASLLLALAYLNDGNRGEAIASYQRLIKAAPQSDEGRQAADNLKMLMAEDGRIADYSKFIASVPGAKAIEPTELDNLSFAAAERDYLTNRSIDRITQYLADFGDGASRPAALVYAIEAARQAKDHGRVIAYAGELVERYPDNQSIGEALQAKAESEMSNGRIQDALASYRKLSETASSPYMVNDARIGIIRAASQLGLNDEVIESADALTASSTISDSQRSEARYSRAKANAAKGNNEAAVSEWSELASNLDNLYGSMSAYEVAALRFEAGDLKGARSEVERLADTPYDYWYARAIILLSDINRAEGNDYEAELYLTNLRDKYPGTETDIFEMIDTRLKK